MWVAAGTVCCVVRSHWLWRRTRDREWPQGGQRSDAQSLRWDARAVRASRGLLVAPPWRHWPGSSLNTAHSAVGDTRSWRVTLCISRCKAVALHVILSLHSHDAGEGGGGVQGSGTNGCFIISDSGAGGGRRCGERGERAHERDGVSAQRTTHSSKP